MKEPQQVQNKGVQISDKIFNYRNGSLIRKNGEEIFLGHRLKDFFKILIDNKNKVVTRVDLMDFVWKDVMVSDESVTKAASDLRKFFATNNMTDFKLTTINRLGYKLEIVEADLRKTNYIKHSLKAIGYVIFIILVIIILIRAIKY
jgi:DNA-binding winged helix-turn-helix (wHTH) protein